MKDKKLFQLAKEVAGMAYDYASPQGGVRWLQDRRNFQADPRYHQTESGIFLMMRNGKPYSLWTPWGEWRCWGKGDSNWREVMPEFLYRLGAVEHLPYRESVHRGIMEGFGPVYRLTKVDKTRLPKAKERSLDCYLAHTRALASWRELAKPPRPVGAIIP